MPQVVLAPMESAWIKRELIVRGLKAGDLVAAGFAARVVTKLLHDRPVDDSTLRRLNAFLLATPPLPEMAYVANGLKR